MLFSEVLAEDFGEMGTDLECGHAGRAGWKEANVGMYAIGRIWFTVGLGPTR